MVSALEKAKREKINALHSQLATKVESYEESIRNHRASIYRLIVELPPSSSLASPPSLSSVALALPEAPSTTPGLDAARKCEPNQCTLPYCFCSSDGTKPPKDMDPKDMIVVTFDDAVNLNNYEKYLRVFRGRANPNGCPTRGTFFVTHEYSNYHMIQDLYAQGHEIALHTVTHSTGLENENYETWTNEMIGMRDILRRFANVSVEDLLGMRAPFIMPGRNAQYEVLRDFKLAYDSSIGVPPSPVPVWPYTLDYQIPHECKAGTCPTNSFPGLGFSSVYLPTVANAADKKATIIRCNAILPHFPRRPSGDERLPRGGIRRRRNVARLRAERQGESLAEAHSHAPFLSLLGGMDMGMGMGIGRVSYWGWCSCCQRLHVGGPIRMVAGIWELPLNAHYVSDYDGGHCPFLDQCVLFNHEPKDILQWLKEDFLRYYNKNRAPYHMSFHTNWFQQPKLEDGLGLFLDWALQQPNVYMVTATQALLWVTEPADISQIKNFEPWDCKKLPKRGKPCNNPVKCGPLLFKTENYTGSRYMTTCFECPRVYPWLTNSAGSEYSKADIYRPEIIQQVHAKTN
ncbi:unnamed protein product [Darwinula stevensoni]|uniref:NodB homology domain-containing protein n=1 Tax=Darwinula stevensoni TaxID=69355 RepID=A0A7R8X5Q0_9CRUS|nr:unnamed protein product [Darwinula stevensoni]CAG0887318.1 unnamed protein product [Darwinula stevensoni]